MSLNNRDAIEGFLDSLYGATLYEFKVLKWETDPAFRIVTSKGAFTLPSNDIGIFIDEMFKKFGEGD